MVIPCFVAARDELLLRGVVLRVLPNGGVSWFRLLGCGLAQAAAAWGQGFTAPTILAGAFFGGVACGALWLRDHGAWLAWGARAAFLWAATALSAGALLDLRPTHTETLALPWQSPAALAVVAAIAIVSTFKRWNPPKTSA